jgi:hypothetical protein
MDVESTHVDREELCAQFTTCLSQTEKGAADVGVGWRIGAAVVEIRRPKCDGKLNAFYGGAVDAIPKL